MSDEPRTAPLLEVLDRHGVTFVIGGSVGARSVLEAEGLRMLTDVERTDAAAWCLLYAPDGTVLEIIGPASLPR